MNDPGNLPAQPVAVTPDGATGHTPGPWLIEDQGEAQEILTEDGRYAVAWSTPKNAHLIAAAPDLLEALKYAAHSLAAMRPTFAQAKDEGHAFHDQVIDTVNAAIAKAEGRSPNGVSSAAASAASEAAEKSEEFRYWLKNVRDWSGSAFLSGEKVEDEAALKSALYGDLCRLGNYLMWWADEAAGSGA